VVLSDVDTLGASDCFHGARAHTHTHTA